jgi:hypothetical protein
MRDLDTISFDVRLKKVKMEMNRGVGRDIEYSAYAGNKNVRERKTVSFSLPVNDEVKFIAFIIENDTHPDKGRGEVAIPVSDFELGEKRTVKVEVEVTENDPPKKGKKALWVFIFDVEVKKR